jgi:hypothetical protein
MEVTAPARFFAKVEEQPNGCWLWIGGLDRKGYGKFHVTKKREARAHRWCFEYVLGSIPEGLDLDHTCRNRRCVNPSHLEPVTRRVNLLRGETIPAAHARKTHCPQGHAYSPENTYLYRGMRQCVACRKTRDQRRSR